MTHTKSDTTIELLHWDRETGECEVMFFHGLVIKTTVCTDGSCVAVADTFHYVDEATGAAVGPEQPFTNGLSSHVEKLLQEKLTR